MPRIPDDELERLKNDIPLVRLVEAKGFHVVRHGAKDWAIRCPFHDGDDTPSCVISPDVGKFHCFACGKGGDVIRWVELIEGVSFRHAVEILRRDYPSLTATLAGKPPARASVPKLPCQLPRDADDQALRNQVAEIYRETFERESAPKEYLAQRGLDVAALAPFKLGYANRTLGYQLPEKNRIAGAELRGRLQKLGIIRESGHELLSGSLVTPIFDAAGNVVQMYGRKIVDNLRAGTPKHLYLPGRWRGVWNEQGLAEHEEVILCEALIDAMTFWCAGFRNVTASYGVNGFTDEHLAAFKRYGIKRVLIAYDRDDPGDNASKLLGERLRGEGFDCYRVLFAHGMDANEHARKVTPAGKSLELVIRNAAWLGKGARPARPQPSAPPALPAIEVAALPEPAPAAKEKTMVDPDDVPFVAEPIELPPLAAKDENTEPAPVAVAPAARETAPPLAASPPATPSPRAQVVDIPTEVNGDEVTMTLGDRSYRSRGLGKNMSYEVLKVNLQVTRGDAFHVDSLDLYVGRHRQTFIAQAAHELGVQEETVKKDLRHVLKKLEDLQDAQIKKALEPKVTLVALNADEKAAALDLLKAPDLVDRILDAFERCGVVGERTNKLVALLACVSRKLDEPLAIIVQSNSAAGKTALQQAVLALMPEEDRIQYSAMTGQSLFYMGEKDLRHKILAISEEEGVARASYALKLLQSEGELCIASTGKDPVTGKLVTHEYRVKGPIMLFLTSTAIEIDEEIRNRCILLTVDEGREQTRAIHRVQREMMTLEGLLAKRTKPKVLKLHQDAQRLLRPLLVHVPYARRLTFIDTQTRTRRDHTKYLALIASYALLHQYQRTVHKVVKDGEEIEYIDATLEDVAAAGVLANEALGRTLSELAPQSESFLDGLHAMVRAACEGRGIDQEDYRFSRREVREHTRLSDKQVRVHLDRLVDLEYVLVHRGSRGQSFEYELLWRGEGKDGRPFVLGLIDAAMLRQEEATGTTSNLVAFGGGFVVPQAGFVGGSWPQSGPIVGASCTPGNGSEPRTDAASSGSNGNGAENAYKRGKREDGPVVPAGRRSNGQGTSGRG